MTNHENRGRWQVAAERPIELTLAPPRVPDHLTIVGYVKPPRDAWCVLVQNDEGAYSAVTLQHTLRTVDQRKVAAALNAL